MDSEPRWQTWQYTVGYCDQLCQRQREVQKAETWDLLCTSSIFQMVVLSVLYIWLCKLISAICFQQKYSLSHYDWLQQFAGYTRYLCVLVFVQTIKCCCETNWLIIMPYEDHTSTNQTHLKKNSLLDDSRHESNVSHYVSLATYCSLAEWICCVF